MLSLQQVSYAYREGKNAVDNVSFDVRAGDTWGIAGGSGSGKSTLCNLIVGMLMPSSGKILYGEEEVYSLKKKGLINTRVQMVLQNPETTFNPSKTMFYSMREAHRLAKKCAEKEGTYLGNAADWESVDFGSAIHHNLELLELTEEMMSRRPDELSGGQLQRFSLLRALLMRPSLLVLDEFTSMLDTLVQAKMIELLKRIKNERNLTYLLVTHDIYLLQEFADYALVMNEGKPAFSGAVSQMEESGYVRELIRYQTIN